MRAIDRLEQATSLDKLVTAGQRAARLLRPGPLRDVLHGTWLGHPVHPVLVQGAAGSLLSATVLDLTGSDPAAARRLTAVGLAAAAPAIVTGAADWSEQHEQQMRVGVVHAAANAAAVTCYGASLLARRAGTARALRLGGLGALAAGGLLGGHLSFRQAAAANHAEAVPHLIEPGWHDLMAAGDLAEGKPARAMAGQVPVVAVRAGGRVHVLADQCSHLSGPLSDGEVTGAGLNSGELDGGCLTCPWHGSTFRLADGSVARGPATSPQPVFQVREAAGTIQICLPGAG